MEKFLQQLSEYESTSDTFNPWVDYDSIYDCLEQAPKYRLAYLREYLSCRVQIEIVLWNIFPFHPYKKEQGKLSNRPPRAQELLVGKHYLKQLVALCPDSVQIVAIGEKAASQLGKGYPKVRHPANGGATLFREQMSKLVS